MPTAVECSAREAREQNFSLSVKVASSRKRNEVKVRLSSVVGIGMNLKDKIREVAKDPKQKRFWQNRRFKVKGRAAQARAAHHGHFEENRCAHTRTT